MMMRSLLLFLILNLVVNTPGTLGQDKLEFQLENKMRRHYEVDGGDTRGRNLDFFRFPKGLPRWMLGSIQNQSDIFFRKSVGPAKTIKRMRTRKVSRQNQQLKARSSLV